MIAAAGSLELAHARLLARHGARATALDWQRLETARTLDTLLQAARQSPLRPWVVGLTAHSSAQDIDTALRQQGLATVQELAGWMPPAWQPALDWCALLPDLPALQHLARAGAALPWMTQQEPWRALCTAPPGPTARVLAASRLAALAPGWAEPARLGHWWWQGWQARVPAGARTEPGLLQLQALLRAHLQAFADAAPGSGTPLRRELQARLRLLLRRVVLQPAAAFVHLALCALDLERLRGELLARVLFPPWAGEA